MTDVVIQPSMERMGCTVRQFTCHWTGLKWGDLFEKKQPPQLISEMQPEALIRSWS